MAASLLVAGPIVATILVRLTMTSLQCPVPSAMAIDAWLEKVLQDATRRGLPALRPLLEGLGRSMSALRAADWNDDASGKAREPRTPDVR